MSRPLLREGNAGERSVNAVDIFFQMLLKSEKGLLLTGLGIVEFQIATESPARIASLDCCRYPRVSRHYHPRTVAVGLEKVVSRK